MSIASGTAQKLRPYYHCPSTGTAWGLGLHRTKVAPGLQWHCIGNDTAQDQHCMELSLHWHCMGPCTGWGPAPHWHSVGSGLQGTHTAQGPALHQHWNSMGTSTAQALALHNDQHHNGIV